MFRIIRTKTCDLYIFTEELTSLEELMKTKTFAEDEVVDFGIQMSEMLETLEAKNIFTVIFRQRIFL